MTGLPVNSYNRQILNVGLGLIFDENNEAAGFSLSINDKCVMMTAIASPSSFNEQIKNAVENAFEACAYDHKEKRFLFPQSLFDGVDDNLKKQKDTSSASASESHLVEDGTPQEGNPDEFLKDEITEAQAKGIQQDLEKNGFPFDYPPQDDYSQIPPNDIPEAMFDTLKTGSTEQPKWKPNVQRLQKVSR